MPKQAQHLEVDSPWKDLIELYLEAFSPFLDWMLVLPLELTLEFDQFVHHYEEAKQKQMRYVTSFEQRSL